MPRRLSKLGLIALALVAAPAAAKDKVAPDAFSVSMPAPPPAPPSNGAIFQSGYTPLTSGGRAGQVGDIITIQLVERTAATKSNAANTQRDGSIGLTPPATGPFSLFDPSDVGASGTQQFKGKGDASQSNALSGEVSVTVAAVYPNGTMLVKGEKLLGCPRLSQPRQGTKHLGLRSWPSTMPYQKLGMAADITLLRPAL